MYMYLHAWSRGFESLTKSVFAPDEPEEPLRLREF